MRFGEGVGQDGSWDVRAYAFATHLLGIIIVARAFPYAATQLAPLLKISNIEKYHRVTLDEQIAFISACFSLMLGIYLLTLGRFFLERFVLPCRKPDDVRSP